MYAFVLNSIYIYRPDMTCAVDWTLKTNCLSIYVYSSGFSTNVIVLVNGYTYFRTISIHKTFYLRFLEAIVLRSRTGHCFCSNPMCSVKLTNLSKLNKIDWMKIYKYTFFTKFKKS